MAKYYSSSHYKCCETIEIKIKLAYYRSQQFYLTVLKKNLNKNQIFFLVKTCILYKKHYKSDNLLFHIFIQNANDKYQNDL